MKSTQGSRIYRAAQIMPNIIPSTKLTVQGKDKKIVLKGIDLHTIGVKASILFDNNVTIVNAQTSIEVVCGGGGSDPVVSLFNNDLSTSVCTVTIDKSAAALEHDNCSAIGNAQVAGGHTLNVSVTTIANASGVATLVISYNEYE
jgi:hypothetical protein